jgi:putative transposase
MASKKSGMIFARNVLLKIDAEASAILDGQSKIRNRLHNDLIDIVGDSIKSLSDIKASNETDIDKSSELDLIRTLYTKNGLRDLVPGIKERHPFYKSVASSPLKNVARRLNRSIKNFQDSKTGKRKGPKIGWPKYKSWKKEWYSIEYEERGKGWSIENNELKLTFGVDKDGKRLSLNLQMEDPPRDIVRFSRSRR